VDHEHDDRADYGNQRAVEIESSDARGAEVGKQEAVHDRANDSEDKNEDRAFLLAINPAMRPRISRATIGMTLPPFERKSFASRTISYTACLRLRRSRFRLSASTGVSLAGRSRHCGAQHDQGALARVRA
jgi:hypothetical protein